ncbi:hydrogen gas-evolving membrane-bound hydrogenase subunit E [Sorangium sp. So ce1014]|uniref:hydrogen gas-evolving membrane-bound hydrogenase subunit E n=1 Tax=Sorangium sp. So ce1014 TaxID=3133326 RepID=UPI003F5F63DA
MLPTLAWTLAVPFLGAALVLFLSSRWAGRVALLPPALLLVIMLPRWPEVSAGGSTTVPIEWIPSLGITANLRLDRLGAFFVLLVAGVGLGVVQYSRVYLGPKGKPTYWAALLAFMGAMIGVALSDSLVLLYVFWELTTIASALLIGMDSTDPEARSGAIRAFLVTGAGGLAMLAGVVLLGQLAGTYNLSELAPRAGEIVASPLHVTPLMLLLAGAFTKSAQFPFHFWLPGAMAAPAPVSAYLHSATMVKGGILLMGRLFPVFHASPAWRPVLVTVGLTTFVVAGWDALRAWDLKKLLAYSTVAYLGVLTALYGLYTRAGTRGELLNIANHALYKSSLFLLVGWMERVTGTRDLSILKEEHWFRREPVAGVLIGFGAAAMAGFPFVLGFISKEVLYEALLSDRSPAGVVALVAAVVGGAFAVAYALKLFVSSFWGPDIPPEDRGHPRRQLSPWLLVVPLLLLAPQVIGGVAPGWLGSLLEPGAERLGWLAVWHHVDALFALSLITIALGVGGYLLWRRVAKPPGEPETQILSDRISGAVLRLSGWAGRAAQAGGLPRYLAVMLLFAAAASCAAVALGDGLSATRTWGPDLGISCLPALMIVAGAALTPFGRSRIARIVTMAVAGYGVAVFYILFRAPDLVLTQILVETVSLILLLLVFRRLPRPGPDVRPRSTRVAHAAVAGTVAALAAALAWSSGVQAPRAPAGAEQLALSLPEAHGRNAVNVILVDFRGADTLGEITVLAVAALGVAALRPRRAPAPTSRHGGGGSCDHPS